VIQLPNTCRLVHKVDLSFVNVTSLLCCSVIVDTENPLLQKRINETLINTLKDFNL